MGRGLGGWKITMPFAPLAGQVNRAGHVPVVTRARHIVLGANVTRAGHVARVANAPRAGHVHHASNITRTEYVARVANAPNQWYHVSVILHTARPA